MTPNDAQIDVLLRRYAGQSQSASATEHLDADELNAFAEGSLPEAARSRYVSHLADCDGCRKIVSQLAISSGAVVAAETSRAPDASGYAWWKRFSGFFSPMTLRYAAFAIVLVAVVGVVFLFMRRPAPESSMVAQNEPTQNEPTKQAPASAVKPTNESAPANPTESKPTQVDRPVAAAQPSQSSDQISKLDQTKTGDTVSPPKPVSETETTTSPALAAKKAAEPGESSQNYSPPPPPATQRAEDRYRPQTGGIASMGGPRKLEQQQPQQTADKQQTINSGRAGAGKDNQAEDDNRRGAVYQNQANRGPADEKLKGPKRDVDNAANNRNSNEVRGNASKTQTADEEKRESKEKPPETRSAGGRKFNRQGNAWVDAKFKSSMSLTNVSRGSSEFDALDSGLRSIAQQLGGEVIIVWKNKAYLIK